MVALGERREIRLFISSTFQDMQEERNELSKFTFPAICKLCAVRGVTFTEVDLRWGITDEQKDDVLPICLSEIDRCRPFFIGILGDRYGWVPESIPASLCDRYPWLNDCLDRSVTELEMLHGVLHDPAGCEHACFYFRDPDFAPECADTDRHRKGRLVALRQRIRASGARIRDNYPSPQALARMVLADLVSLVDQYFPAPTGDTVVPEEHDAYIPGRTVAFVGRNTDLERLNKHAGQTDGGLILIGEPGSGKSTILSEWVVQYRGAHPGQHVLEVFPAAAGESRWPRVVLQILERMKRQFGLFEEIPDTESGVRTLFAQWLRQVAASHGLVLVVDGLDQLEEPADDRELAWFPDPLPPGLRLVVAAAPGRTFAAAQRRNWAEWLVGHLSVDLRRGLIVRYLAHYGKRLSQDRVERIAGAEQAASPLFLRTLLDELRLHGGHETRAELIDQHLKAPTVPALMEQILARYELDYDRARPGLVREVLCLIWAARYGLTEEDILQLVGVGDDPPLREAILHLFLALDHWFRYGNAGYSLASEHMRRAVAERYLSGEAERSVIHGRMRHTSRARTRRTCAESRSCPGSSHKRPTGSNSTRC